MDDFYLYRKAWRYHGPPHEEPALQRQEWKSLLKRGGLMVRNTYDFDSPEPRSFWYVIKDQYGGIEEYSSNERNKIRRSLKTLGFRKIDRTRLREEGWPILEATYRDYAVRDRKMDEKIFRDYLDSCEKDPFDYWGIFDQEQLVGFCTVWLWSADSCEYGLIGIRPEYKHNNTYPYYGLFHQLDEYYLGECHYRYVADGARSVTEHSQIQEFLVDNFHFRKAYCKLEIHYQWWMKLAVKILYPFRKIIPIPAVKAVLHMEEMQR